MICCLVWFARASGELPVKLHVIVRHLRDGEGSPSPLSRWNIVGQVPRFRFEERAVGGHFYLKRQNYIRSHLDRGGGDLVNGLTVTLPDGRKIEPDQVLGESRQGTSLVVVGDTGNPDKLLPYIQDADALVIEATYTQMEEDLARRFDHLTAAQAAGVAKRANVKELYLTHLSRRYRERDVLDEARTVFPSVHVARDFDEFQIRRES